MKKIVLVLILCFGAITVIPSLELNLGIKGGPAVGLPAGSPIPEDYESVQIGFSWSAGLALDLIFVDLFALELDALFAMNDRFGYNADPAINGVGSTQQTISTMGLDFPLLAKFRLGKGLNKWTLFAGPDLMVLLGSAPRLYQNGIELGVSQDYANNVLLGLVAGYGYEFSLRKGRRLVLELRYTRTLTYFYTSETNAQGSDAGFQRFDLMFGYYFL